MYKPWENEELLSFKRYLESKLKEMIIILFEGENEEIMKKFAFQNLNRKLIFIKEKANWTFDELSLQFQNLNYYLTLLDSFQLTLANSWDIEDITVIPILKRSEIFNALRCTEDIQNEILKSRKKLTRKYSLILEDLKLTLTKISLEEWFSCKLMNLIKYSLSRFIQIRPNTDKTGKFFFKFKHFRK